MLSEPLYCLWKSISTIGNSSPFIFLTTYLHRFGYEQNRDSEFRSAFQQSVDSEDFSGPSGLIFNFSGPDSFLGFQLFPQHDCAWKARNEHCKSILSPKVQAHSSKTQAHRFESGLTPRKSRLIHQKPRLIALKVGSFPENPGSFIKNQGSSL